MVSSSLTLASNQRLEFLAAPRRGSQIAAKDKLGREIACDADMQQAAAEQRNMLSP